MIRTQPKYASIPLINRAERLDERFHGAVIAIGNFDGMHLGHQRILAEARERADRRNCAMVVFTFEPHPRAVLFPESPPTRLTSLEEKRHQLALYGCDGVYAQKFDNHFASMSAEDFVSLLLVKNLRTRHVVVGENFRFGEKQAGDVELLRRLGARFNFGVSAVPLFEHLGDTVSSTRIRDLLAHGQILQASALLGRSAAVDTKSFTQGALCD